MDKLTAIKIKYDDGTYSDEIPVSVLSENVEWDNTHTLVDVLGSIDVDTTGTIQDQISQLFNEKVSNTQLNTYVANELNADVTAWLQTNVNPVGSVVTIDYSLSVEGSAPDSKETGKHIFDLEEDLKPFANRQLLNAKDIIRGSLYNRNNTTIQVKEDYSRYPKLRLKAGTYYLTGGNFAPIFSCVKTSTLAPTEIDHLESYEIIKVDNISVFKFSMLEDFELYISAYTITDFVRLYTNEPESLSSDYEEGFLPPAWVNEGKELKNFNNKIFNLCSSLELIEGEYIIMSNGETGGGTVGQQFHRTDYIEIPSNAEKIYLLSTFHHGEDGLAFYNQNKIFISGYGDTSTQNTYITLDVPSNAKYIRLSGFKEDNLEVYLYYSKMGNMLSSQVDRGLNNKINYSHLSSLYPTQKILADISNVRPGGSGMKIIDGKIVHEWTWHGNSWWTIPIQNWDTNKNHILLEITVDEITSNNPGRLLLFGQKPDGSNCWNAIEDFNVAKKYKWDIDLNWYVVYKNLDLTQPIAFGVANSESGDEEPYKIIISEIYVQDFITNLDTSKTMNENFNDIVNNININKTNITALENTIKAETIKIAPNGKKFIIQVQNDGTTIAVPVLPSNITYIGNSLLFGFGTFGMAATRSTEDYYYYINSYLQEQGNTLTTNKVSGSTYEGSTTTSEAENWLNNTLIPALDVNKELVLIQLSDNVNTDEKRSYFQSEGAEKLIATIRQYAPKARVVWMAAWYANTNNITAIVNACKKYGASFINLRDLPSIEGNTSYVGAIYYDDDGNEHKITSAGVASHPSSQGMRAIADRVIETLFEV